MGLFNTFVTGRGLSPNLILSSFHVFCNWDALFNVEENGVKNEME